MFSRRDVFKLLLGAGASFGAVEAQRRAVAPERARDLFEEQYQKELSSLQFESKAEFMRKEAERRAVESLTYGRVVMMRRDGTVYLRGPEEEASPIEASIELFRLPEGFRPGE